MRYRKVFQQVSQFAGTPITTIHVPGGSARNTRMNQWLADALGVPVVAGPHEATASGNALMQLVGLGELHTLAEVRAVARHAPTRLFEPQASQRPAWDEAMERFREICQARA